MLAEKKGTTDEQKRGLWDKQGGHIKGGEANGRGVCKPNAGGERCLEEKDDAPKTYYRSLGVMTAPGEKSLGGTIVMGRKQGGSGPPTRLKKRSGRAFASWRTLNGRHFQIKKEAVASDLEQKRGK